jgi:hypothetical protein
MASAVDLTLHISVDQSLLRRVGGWCEMAASIAVQGSEKLVGESVS